MNRISRLYLLLLGAAPALAATALTAAPVIKADRARIDFGTYPANQRREHTFVITNAGDAPLKIIRIRKTCGCSETHCDKTDLQPGETARLSAVIKAESVAGAYSKSVFVESNDPKQNFLLLTLNGQAQPPATIKPQAKLYLGTLPPKQSRTQEFVITPNIADLQLGQPQIVGPASVRPVRQSDGKYQVAVTLLPSGVSGTMKAQIKIPITAPAGWNPLEIVVMARVQEQGDR
ncbi:MAG: DUF1573 domain-containing protein [Victivallales bacterium]|nr:DUF1573 domain-containing protein [Victivallales bacterium]